MFSNLFLRVKTKGKTNIQHMDKHQKLKTFTRKHIKINLNSTRADRLVFFYRYHLFFYLRYAIEILHQHSNIFWLKCAKLVVNKQKLKETRWFEVIYLKNARNVMEN